VSASVNGSAQVVYGNKNWRTSILGTHIDYAPMRSYEPAVGRFFNKEELLRQDKVAVVGYTILRELFGDKNPIGAIIKINRVNFRVIGLLPEKGSSGWRDMDDMIIIPITTAMNRLLGKEYIDSIDVEVRDISLMDAAQESLKQLIISRHRLSKEQAESAFEIRNMQEIQQAVESTTSTMTMLLGSIAGISLFVGGIGIMNIMLVAVKERTKEIGLRKAIGARSSDIMAQFLIEAVVMTMLGGIIGILLGSGIAYIISLVANWKTSVSMSSILLSVGFSIVVGISFGMWPAYQAAKLKPIEALRYE
jgi:macrolide transport system ATP-binding/permease protein